MAIFSFHVGVVSRSAGGKKRKGGSTRKMKTPRSCQAAAAYKRAGKIEVAGQTWNYTRKKDVVPFGVYCPSGTPPISSEDLWIKADAAEKRKDATTAREGHAALPNECTPKEWTAIMDEFAAWMCATHRVAVDMNYHHERGNPHIDFQFSTREYLPDGTLGAKTRQLDDRKTGSILVEAMREKWAAICNRYLARYGTSIDHRSYERQGLDKLPQIHLGQAATELESKGVRTERGDFNRAVRRINNGQKEIRQELQRLRGELHEQKNGRNNRVDQHANGEKIRKNRHYPSQSTSDISLNIQGRNSNFGTRPHGAILGTSAERAGVLPRETGRTPGSNTPANIPGDSGASCAPGASEQRRTSTVRRDRGIGRTTLGSGKDSSRHAGTASGIISLLGKMRQNIAMQVDAANLNILIGGKDSLLHVAQITKAIQRLTAEVKKAADVANLKILKEVHHGTQETAKEKPRGTRSHSSTAHGDS